MTLQTPRLVFREFTPEDAALVFELNNDTDVLKYLHEHPTTDHATALATLQERIIPHYREYGYGRWAVHLKDTNEFIGWCGLKFRPERNETDLGYRFMQRFWNKGYATEAAKATLDYGFQILHLPKITAIAQTGNLASLQVIEKCGMVFKRYEIIDGFEVKTYELLAETNPLLSPLTS